jgi:diguanylate cyclase (GGDEF)-like protein/PAS domain S-box-containing protein
MHPLLRKQLSKAVGGDGALDIDRLTALVSATYDDADKDRRRTDRAITLMVEELAQLNEQLEAKVVSRTAELEATRKTLSAALENVDQGIMMVAADDRLHVCNRRASQLLDLPADIAERRPLLAEVVAEQFAAKEFVEIDPAVVEFWCRMPLAQGPAIYERRRPNGIILEIRAVQLAGGGCVRTFTDITERREREAQIVRAEADYRGLFENAVIGIFRSSIDGRQLRANPALVRLTGYESEAEMLRAVNDIGAEWYVEPNRRAEFRARVDAHGRVDDFLSEVYRHRTRERIWVSESARLVRSESGEPLYYEGTVIDSSERVRAEARIAYLARHDALTDLPTRRSFLESLQTALGRRRRGRTIAVHCIDLDRFKDVNDTLGHPAGDELLRVAAKRLRVALRGVQDIARLGGDEFAVIQHDVADRSQAEELAARLVRILSARYKIGGAAVYVGASVGVILAAEDCAEPDELMKNVDIALYRAKAEGRSTYRVFDPSMSESAQRRRALETDLRRAVPNNELAVYLQPIVDIASRAIVGFEALLRWRHPQRGLMSPGEFISIAEETGLIDSIGEWVLADACRLAAASGGDFTISVNLSPAQFRTRRVSRAVKSALFASGLSASRLVLEITESVLLMDDDQTKAALSELRALGVRFALDDFGTGHSSLSYLQKFRFDTIKIDRSFVALSAADQVNATLVRAVVSLGRELGILVVAEGIETEDQREKLTSQGCRYAQGYLFGRPRPAREWLEQFRASANTSLPQRLSA